MRLELVNSSSRFYTPLAIKQPKVCTSQLDIYSFQLNSEQKILFYFEDNILS